MTIAEIKQLPISDLADEKAQHQKEITRLQKIEDEILDDIRNERYEQALLKHKRFITRIRGARNLRQLGIPREKR